METIGDGNLADFVRKMASVGSPDEWFETGLELILDGLARRFKLDT